MASPTIRKTQPGHREGQHGSYWPLLLLAAPIRATAHRNKPASLHSIALGQGFLKVSRFHTGIQGDRMVRPEGIEPPPPDPKAPRALLIRRANRNDRQRRLPYGYRQLGYFTVNQWRWRHIGNRDQNRDRTVTRSWSSNHRANVSSERQDTSTHLGRSALRFKFAACDAALADDGLEGAQSNFVMIRDRDSHGSGSGPALHDDMTATTPDFYKTMPS